MKKEFQFNKELLRRLEFAGALCKEIRGYMTKGGTQAKYANKIEARLVMALVQTNYLDGHKMQGDLSLKAIHELREKLKTPAQAAKELEVDVRNTRYAISKIKAKTIKPKAVGRDV